MDLNKIWKFYVNLDKEVKIDFMTEIMSATNWSKSTFYTRVQSPEQWKAMEIPVVTTIYEKYLKKYGQSSC